MLRGLEGRRIALVLPDESRDSPAEVVRRTLEQAGAQVDALTCGLGNDEDWHGGKYAALVAIGADREASSATEDPRLAQLVREFLVSEKPVAAIGQAVDALIESGGAAGRTVAIEASARPALEAAGGRASDSPMHSDGCLVSATGTTEGQDFAEQVVKSFSAHLEERDVDEMSEQSFPASDPPATTPVSGGHVVPERDPGTPAQGPPGA